MGVVEVFSDHILFVVHDLEAEYMIDSFEGELYESPTILLTQEPTS